MYNLNFSPIFYEKRALYMQKFTHIPNSKLCQSKNKDHLKFSQKYLPRFTPRKTAATRLHYQSKERQNQIYPYQH